MRRALLVVGAVLVAALCGDNALAQGRKAAAPQGQELGAMLKDAQNFTVKARSTVTWPIEGERAGSGQGTAFFIDKTRGWFLTNAHVARSSPGTVDISFGDADTDWIQAERVYVDNLIDVAILRLDPAKIPASAVQARLGCTRNVEQGAPVVAYGNPRDLNFTATRGIVSSVRTLGVHEFIQMDASLNPGNSGGALLSLDSAEVVGVTTASAGSGLGFATPMRHICPILDLLRAGKDPTVPTLPVYWEKAGNAETLLVAQTFPNASADFPLKPGDEVIGLAGGAKFAGLPDLFSALRGRSGDVKLNVRRDQTMMEIAAPITPAVARLKRQALTVSGMLIDDDRRADAEASVLPRLHVDFLKPGEVAERAGFRMGDSLVQLNGRSFGSVLELQAWLKSLPAEETVKVLVRRRGGGAREISAEYLRLELKVEDVLLVGGGA